MHALLLNKAYLQMLDAMGAPSSNRLVVAQLSSTHTTHLTKLVRIIDPSITAIIATKGNMRVRVVGRCFHHHYYYYLPY